MSIKDLLRGVTSAESEKDYWAVQQELVVAIERQERIIRRRERRHASLRKGIKRCSAKSSASPEPASEYLQRLQCLLSVNQRSEDDHRFARGALLYLGDALAYNLMPDHVVRMHGRNSSPGFFGGKSGRTQEFDIGAFLTNEGWTVLLHDLTHCLKIGDLTALCRERGIISIECGAGRGARKERQSQRMKLHIRFETSTGDSYVLLGPRPIENVQFGLASLESALQMLTESVTIPGW